MKVKLVELSSSEIKSSMGLNRCIASSSRRHNFRNYFMIHLNVLIFMLTGYMVTELKPNVRREMQIYIFLLSFREVSNQHSSASRNI